MLIFAKLISGEIILGMLNDDIIMGCVIIEYLSDNSVVILPVIPFSAMTMPLISIHNITCYVDVDEIKYASLVKTYLVLKSQIAEYNRLKIN